MGVPFVTIIGLILYIKNQNKEERVDQWFASLTKPIPEKVNDITSQINFRNSLWMFKLSRKYIYLLSWCVSSFEEAFYSLIRHKLYVHIFI